MFTYRFALLALLAGCFTIGVAQEKGADGGAEKVKVKVEVAFEAEHVPAGLAAKARVDLKRVDGKTTAGNRITMYETATVVPDIEVISVMRLEKPKTPEQAVKVELRVTKEQAEKIEKLKELLVTVVENKPGGGTVTKKRPVILRLESVKPPKK